MSEAKKKNSFMTLMPEVVNTILRAQTTDSLNNHLKEEKVTPALIYFTTTPSYPGPNVIKLFTTVIYEFL